MFSLLSKFYFVNDQLLCLGTFREVASLSLVISVIMAELHVSSKYSRLFCEHCEEKYARGYTTTISDCIMTEEQEMVKNKVVHFGHNAEHVPQANGTVDPTEYESSFMHYPMITKMEDLNKVLYTRIS